MPSQTKINVLLTDDDKDDRFFFDKALKKTSIPASLITLSDGVQLLDHLSKGKENFPDILFLDVNMPRKNGLESLTELKKIKEAEGLPIIMYSTALTERAMDAFYINGAYRYLKKGDFNELVQSLTHILNTFKAGSLVKETRANFSFKLKDQ